MWEESTLISTLQLNKWIDVMMLTSCDEIKIGFTNMPMLSNQYVFGEKFY